jgi:16S rRNA (adenine1518-N6/adenine1519-N6)-dimethyltransferase
MGYKEVRAKKHLGQHFLIDETVTENITLGLTNHNDCKSVIEVGPGMGALTKYLINYRHDAFRVTEIDQESIHYLKQHYPDIEIIEEDFLQLDLNQYTIDNKVSVIGNFPYYISSQILFKAYDNKEIVTEVVGMFQKEVADRISSPPGSKRYGILSVLLQAFYDIEYLFTVEPEAFNPPPKVQSAVIRLTRNKVEAINCDQKLFKQVIKAGFNQRRKTLRNSLKAFLTDEIKTDEIFNDRPERLSVEQFIYITNLVQSVQTDNQ